MIRVFDHLRTASAWRAAHVCRAWRAAFFGASTHWTNLRISRLSSETLPSIAKDIGRAEHAVENIRIRRVESVPALASLLLYHVPHARSLNATLHIANWENLTPVMDALPRDLRVLIIQANRSWRLSNVPLHHPSLECLALHRCTSSLHTAALPSTLRHLSLNECLSLVVAPHCPLVDLALYNVENPVVLDMARATSLRFLTLHGSDVFIRFSMRGVPHALDLPSTLLCWNGQFEDYDEDRIVLAPTVDALHLTGNTDFLFQIRDPDTSTFIASNAATHFIDMSDECMMHVRSFV